MDHIFLFFDSFFDQSDQSHQIGILLISLVLYDNIKEIGQGLWRNDRDTPTRKRLLRLQNTFTVNIERIYTRQIAPPIVQLQIIVDCHAAIFLGMIPRVVLLFVKIVNNSKFCFYHISCFTQNLSIPFSPLLCTHHSRGWQVLVDTERLWDRDRCYPIA